MAIMLLIICDRKVVRMQIRRILDETMAKRPVHLTFIDVSRHEVKRMEEIAAVADELGTDGFLVGCTAEVTQKKLSETVSAMKKVTQKPMVLFPGLGRVFSMEMDAVLMLSLLNSRNVDFVIRTHAKSALLLKKMGMEVIPTAYLVVAPGMKAAEIGEADCIDREDLLGAAGYAAAAEMMGFKYLYLECGGGSPVPVPVEMLQAVKRSVDIPVIVGGGIRTAAVARQMIAAGADAIVTGTILDRLEFRHRLSEIIRAVSRA